MAGAAPAPAVSGSAHTRRAHYLEALGIDRYVSRHAPVPAPGSAPASTSTSASADEWETLRAEVAACTKCALCESRTQTVFGVGDRAARWLIVGEAPGAEEDRRGEPFVGRAGQLLNSMLRAVGLSRETVFIANVLKCRPPGNRDPKPDEAASCMPYLLRQVELIEPEVIVAVGRVPAQTLLGTDAAVARLRGRVHRFGDRGIPLVVTYHPAYLLRAPAEKRKAWDDLKLARSLFDGRGPR